MPVIQRAGRELAEIPPGSKLGFLVMVVGLGADLIAHFGPGMEHAHGGAAGAELSAHLVVFLGMVLVLVGVVVDGLRHRPTAETVTQSKETI